MLHCTSLVNCRWRIVLFSKTIQDNFILLWWNLDRTTLVQCVVVYAKLLLLLSPSSCDNLLILNLFHWCSQQSSKMWMSSSLVNCIERRYQHQIRRCRSYSLMEILEATSISCFVASWRDKVIAAWLSHLPRAFPKMHIIPSFCLPCSVLPRFVSEGFCGGQGWFSSFSIEFWVLRDDRLCYLLLWHKN